MPNPQSLIPNTYELLVERLIMPSIWNFPIHPVRASTFADEVDILYFALVGLTIFFTLIVFVMLGAFMFRYRVGSKASRKTRFTPAIRWNCRGLSFR